MADVTTLQSVELGVLGPLQVRQDGAPVTIPGAKPRAILTMLGLHGGSVVSADTLIELLWGDDPPRTAAKALQTHISSLRRALGDGFVLTEGAGWTLAGTEVDASRYKSAAKAGPRRRRRRRHQPSGGPLRGGADPLARNPRTARRPAGSIREDALDRGLMPRWWRTGPMRCSRRAAPRRSSASSKPRWPTRRCARGDGAS